MSIINANVVASFDVQFSVFVSQSIWPLVQTSSLSFHGSALSIACCLLSFIQLMAYFVGNTLTPSMASFNRCFSLPKDSFETKWDRSTDTVFCGLLCAEGITGRIDNWLSQREFNIGIWWSPVSPFTSDLIHFIWIYMSFFSRENSPVITMSITKHVCFSITVEVSPLGITWQFEVMNVVEIFISPIYLVAPSLVDQVNIGHTIHIEVFNWAQLSRGDGTFKDLGRYQRGWCNQ